MFKSFLMLKIQLRNKSAFSLLELMIGIGVIALLIVLLSGGYGYVRRQGLMTGDLNNFRQIAVAYHAYLGENRYRLPPVIGPRQPGDGGAYYAQVALARQMGITADLYAARHDRKEVGVWISPGDQRDYPYLSPLRSYAVNYYAGEIYTLKDNTTAYYYHEVNQAARKIYLLPSDGSSTDPASQARFSPLSAPLIDGSVQTYSIRFYTGDVTPALWMDGHASLVRLDFVRRHAAALIYPKREPPTEME